MGFAIPGNLCYNHSKQPHITEDIMKLYMIRHGQSENNLGARHSGWSPTPLTAQGEEDARRAGELLRGIPFDKVFSSDLRRAVQTCALALPDRQDDVEYTWLLRETNVGSLMEMRVEDCFATLGDAYAKNRRNHDYRDYGGENFAMQDARLREFLERVRNGGWKTVAAFSHYWSINCVMNLVLGTTAEHREYPIKNGAVTVFTFENGTWTVGEGDAR